ncbi:hypothetical protein SCALM49S_03081 [Streptomyces californicus]
MSSGNAASGNQPSSEHFSGSALRGGRAGSYSATKNQPMRAPPPGPRCCITRATRNSSGSRRRPISSAASRISAWAPRPALAIGLPSIAATTAALSPGVLSRIEVVEPPNIAP